MSTIAQTSTLPSTVVNQPQLSASRKPRFRKRQTRNRGARIPSTQPDAGSSVPTEGPSSTQPSAPTPVIVAPVIKVTSTTGTTTTNEKRQWKRRHRKKSAKGKNSTTTITQPLPSNSGGSPVQLPQELQTHVSPTLLPQSKARMDDEPESDADVEEKEKEKTDETLTAEEKKAIKAAKHERKLKERAKKREEHFQLVLAAAEATIAALRQHGISCAAFGSLACRLYGHFRYPKDVDLLILQPPSSDPETPLRTAEQIKTLMLDTNPRHFYLKLPRDPEATYRILYYRSEYLGPECKVDILIPGTMHLPNIPLPSSSFPGTSDSSSASSSNTSTPAPVPITPGASLAPLATNIASPSPHNHLTFISGIPLVPFSLLLLHKLQGWTDHRAAPEKHKQRKQSQDAADVRRLLAMQGMVKELQQTRPWTNRELFSEEFQELTKERVKEYCKEFPDRAASWQMLGFETV